MRFKLFFSGFADLILFSWSEAPPLLNPILGRALRANADTACNCETIPPRRPINSEKILLRIWALLGHDHIVRNGQERMRTEIGLLHVGLWRHNRDILAPDASTNAK
ncbi:hypothetical protein QMZ05_01880 [Bradyrhizobium sp. INPA03-11B]|uniref:hypothetical protein n=1 Tax=Bradyrhizobium sp. INPA03-11B TaxID=418598 RepID=UPI003390303B